MYSSHLRSPVTTGSDEVLGGGGREEGSPPPPPPNQPSPFLTHMTQRSPASSTFQLKEGKQPKKHTRQTDLPSYQLLLLTSFFFTESPAYSQLDSTSLQLPLDDTSPSQPQPPGAGGGGGGGGGYAGLLQGYHTQPPPPDPDQEYHTLTDHQQPPPGYFDNSPELYPGTMMDKYHQGYAKSYVRGKLIHCSGSFHGTELLFLL